MPEKDFFLEYRVNANDWKCLDLKQFKNDSAFGEHSSKTWTVMLNIRYFRVPNNIHCWELTPTTITYW